MAGGIDNLTERVQGVEEKVDRLSASMDRRFDAVDAAFLEQRQYIEFAYSRLEAKMDAGFARFDGQFERVDGRFERVEGRFERVEGRFDRLEGRFDRLERKLDQVIDLHRPQRTRKPRR